MRAMGTVVDGGGAGPPPGEAGPATTLVVAYAFAPDADTSAVAAAKRVVVRGEPVDVISHRLDRLRGTDPSLSELVDGLVRRHARLGGPTSFGGWGAISTFCEAGEAVLQEWGQQPAGTPYTSLFSRAHFVASHVLGALVAARLPDLVWRAEISDPLSRRSTGERRPGQAPRGPLADRLAGLLARRGVRVTEGSTTYAWAETLAYTLADEVVFTSSGQRDHCLSLVEDPRVLRAVEASARVEPHATLPPAWYVRRTPPLQLDPHLRHIGYFGTFYDSQDPRALLTAVARLAREDRARLRLHLFTGPADPVVAAVRETGVEDVVVVRDRLPFLDFLAATRQMDLLLAVDAAPVAGAGTGHVLLSKWSDYVGAGTGVWGLVDRGSELSSQDLAFSTPLGHVTGMMQVLTSVARGEAPAGPGPDPGT